MVAGLPAVEPHRPVSPDARKLPGARPSALAAGEQGRHRRERRGEAVRRIAAQKRALPRALPGLGGEKGRAKRRGCRRRGERERRSAPDTPDIADPADADAGPRPVPVRRRAEGAGGRPVGPLPAAACLRGARREGEGSVRRKASARHRAVLPRGGTDAHQGRDAHPVRTATARGRRERHGRMDGAGGSNPAHAGAPKPTSGPAPIPPRPLCKARCFRSHRGRIEVQEQRIARREMHPDQLRTSCMRTVFG